MKAEPWELIHQGDQAARDLVIEQYVPLVHYVAGRLRINLPAVLDFEDLVGFGMFGLMESVDRFDPSLGYRFITYATLRIRGSILDGLRGLDWATRRLRADARRVAQAASRLNARLGYDPSLEELAGELGEDPAEVDRILSQAHNSHPLSLDERVTTGADDDLTIEGALADASVAIEECAIEAESRERIASGVVALEPTERAMMALYYLEGLTFAQIGSVLGVTESRVYQVHASAMRHLRDLVAL